MDVSENSYDQQNSAAEQQRQPCLEQQQQMQLYDPTLNNGFSQSANAMETTTTATTAIPLPAPPPPPLHALAKGHQSSPATETDIDSLLLQQFSCMGTTDRDDLIMQFQNLMNNQMNKDSAKFFLEMSNWNLQTAVGCYLDFCNFQTIPSMKILEQSRPSELQQAWRLQNDGTEDWPPGCYLLSPSQTRRIEVPAIKAGDTCDILAETLPTTQPVPVMWRLCTPNGWYFGETIWLIPAGTCSSPAELAERMSHLRATSGGAINPEAQVNVVIRINME